MHTIPRQMGIITSMTRKTNAPELKALLDLPTRRRADIALKLIESLDEETDANADALWAKEIERRVQSLQDGKAKTVSWATVKRDLRPRARQS